MLERRWKGIGMTTFYLVRHGKPDWQLKEDRKLHGPIRDYVPLTDTGIAQAEQVVADNAILSKCELILSSPYTRSLQTAATLNRTLGLPLRVEFDLHEWTPDSFQAASIEEIMELHRDYVNLNGIHPPGETRLWEPRANVLRRTTAVLTRYLDRSEVIVVCHGMVIATLMNVDAEEVPFCSVHAYEMDA